MATNSTAKLSLPFGTLSAGVLGCVLYVLMLASAAAPSSGGEAVIGQAYEVLYLTFWLWIVLALLLVIGGVMGSMPRWAAVAAIFLHPLAGVAAAIGIDSYSRHHIWGILFPALLPLIIAFYALWARLPSVHAAFPARITSLAAWGGVLLLSAASLLLAVEY